MKKVKKIRIAIADDNDVFREKIAEIIDCQSDLEVVLQARDGLQLLQFLESSKPDVILLDIRMPVMNGIEAIEQINKLHRVLRVIVLSQYDMEENIVEMNIRGVKSFIGKSDDLDDLFRAIRVVHNNGIYLTERVASIIQRHLVRNVSETMEIHLNDFEKSLLQAICNGKSSREIADILNRSPRTIEEHREKLYKKFNVKSKGHLIATAVRHGFI